MTSRNLTGNPCRDLPLSVDLQAAGAEKPGPLSTANSESASEHWTESRAGEDSKASSGWNNGLDVPLPDEGLEEESYKLDPHFANLTVFESFSTLK